MALIFLSSWFSKSFVLSPDGRAPLLVLLVSICGLGVRYPRESAPFTILTRTIIVVLSVYVGWEAIAEIPKEYELTGISEAMLGARNWGCWIALAFGIVGWWRPSGGILLLSFLHWQKTALGAELGYNLSWIDYLALVEIGQFLVICLLADRIICTLCRYRPNSKKSTTPFILPTAVVASVGIHFANYFWSAIEKLQLQGGPLSWVFENPTHNLLLAAYEGGHLPISQFGALPALAYQLSDHLFIALNIFILTTQLIGVLAVWSRRGTIFLTIIYDITHIGIFILSGIFFWKWILLNFAIIAATRKSQPFVLPPITRFVGVLMVLIAPMFFNIAKLGWYDTRSFTSITIAATLSDGSQHVLPTNFFGPNSVAFAQLPDSYISGHFGTGTYGATSDYRLFKNGNSCSLPAGVDVGKFKQSDFDRLDKAIRQDHIRRSGKLLSSDWPWYNIFPHHIWSNPFAYANASEIKQEDIRGYRVVVDSVCLSVVGDKVVRDSRYVTFHDVALD
ncbi:hypothetical protein [Devosia psychrophila]|nr:hypothetical protein [Devosia psychrophila]